jgi:RNA polymerase sigma-70 factor (ECF subfamily)
MNDEQRSIDVLINAARKQPDWLGVLLERYRSFLVREGNRQLGSRVATRVDPDDLVQETFAKAVQSFPQFSGSSEFEFTAWLMRIHTSCLCDQLRKHVRTEARAVDQEARLYDPNGSESCRALDPVAEQTTASQRVMRAQSEEQLAEALDGLPDAQREAVRLRHLEGLSVQQVAKQLGRSMTAAAGLIKRGIYGLRERMSDSHRQ